ncbi:aspartyl-phosphate phosphatase Spo0E family protein [Schinkia sp. CFF1]
MIIDKNELNNIEFDINKLKVKLIKCGMEKGLTHPTTIALSQKLDKLLNKIQSFKKST